MVSILSTKFELYGKDKLNLQYRSLVIQRLKNPTASDCSRQTKMKHPKNITQFENPIKKFKAQNPNPHQTTHYFSNGQTPNYESRNASCLKQHIIPMIQSLAEQNETIKDEKERLAKQMKVLNSLTKDLLSENQNLRKHFNGRTQDVAKLVFSIQNNVQDDISDHYHLVHLLKQSNGFLVKQIESIRKQEENFLKESQNLGSDLIALNERNFLNQQNVLNKVEVKIKNLYNSEIVNKCQKQFQELIQKEKKLIDDVGQLSRESSFLQQNLKKKSNSNFETNQENRKDKALYCQQIAMCLSNLAKLKQEKNGLQATASNQKRVNEELKTNHSKLSEKFLSLVKKRERMALDFDQIINISKRATIQTVQSKTRAHQNEITLHKKNQQKEALEDKIKRLKNKIRETQRKENEVKNRLNSDKNKEVIDIRTKLRGVQKNCQGEVLNMRKQGQSVQLQIEDAKKQFLSLEDDIKSYQDLVNGLQNPIQQIEKINLTLKLKRDPLGYRN